MPDYDPTIIQNHADDLYAQAEKAPVLSAFASGLIGVVVGLGMSMGLDVGMGSGGLVGTLLGVGAAVLGYQVGKSQAIRMRVAAQTALCQVAIERAVTKDE